MKEISLCMIVKNEERCLEKCLKALEPLRQLIPCELVIADTGSTDKTIEIAKNLKPSARGEIEITGVNNEYLNKNQLNVKLLGRGMAWLDTGTYDGLLEASNFIATIQKRQGMYVSCIEEIAYRNKWISNEELVKLASEYKTSYGEYLKFIAEGNI